MNHPIGFGFQDATSQQKNQLAQQLVDSTWKAMRPMLVALVEGFLLQPLNPAAFFRLRKRLAGGCS